MVLGMMLQPSIWGFSHIFGHIHIIHFNRVFHYFHHPFWGTITFGNIHIGFRIPPFPTTPSQRFYPPKVREEMERRTAEVDLLPELYKKLEYLGEDATDSANG